MRRARVLDKGWTFQGRDGQRQSVNLPHTWNNVDGQDGGNDYLRGKCTYEKNFPNPEYETGERVYLEFRGVNASASVELNGQAVGTHDGGYSTFRFDVTEILEEENHLTVRADNSVNDRVYPQKADFTFYGGIYREVFLRVVPAEHFSMDHLGGEGIKITPTVQGEDGTVRVETYHKISGATVRVRLLDREGREVAAGDSVDVAAGDSGDTTGDGSDIILTIPAVHLWDGVNDPYLYTAEAILLRDGVELDRVSARFGVRSFRVNPDKGFFLNGRPYPLHGVSRHQDWKGIG
ncbi:MAG: glycoside hydrolase family 2 protein, partial [Oscillibacter sp.]|nr:glycoside hydrolase family 2 protein [Oscillibacter sp.]